MLARITANSLSSAAIDTGRKSVTISSEFSCAVDDQRGSPQKERHQIASAVEYQRRRGRRFLVIRLGGIGNNS